MSSTMAARRYAEALADVAFAAGRAAQIEEELRHFAELYETNPELHNAFASPVISQTDKRRILDAIIDRTRPSETMVNLLTLLLRNYRLHQIPALHREFRNQINTRQGVLPAEVTTAGPVGEPEQQLLTRQLETLTGKRVEVKFKTDPSLIGGVVTRLGSVVYDGSIRTRLETMKKELKQDRMSS